MANFPHLSPPPSDGPSPARPTRIYSRRGMEQAFLETFELVGGISRLTLWANEEKNYHEFLKLLTKLFPKEVQKKIEGRVVHITTAVPESPLDGAPRVERVAYAVDDFDAFDASATDAEYVE